MQQQLCASYFCSFHKANANCNSSFNDSNMRTAQHSPPAAPLSLNCSLATTITGKQQCVTIVEICNDWPSEQIYCDKVMKDAF
jgi:hypothetical protein